MERIKFNNCLNKEVKHWNISSWALVIGGTSGAVAGLIKGLFWLVGCGGAGFVIGSWFSYQWWLGNIQRWTYWHLPFGRILLNKRVPMSHHRNLM